MYREDGRAIEALMASGFWAPSDVTSLSFEALPRC